MHDGKVLAACMASRHAYDAVRNNVDAEEFSPQFGAWWPLVERWYSVSVSETTIDREILREKGVSSLPQAHLDTLVGWFDDLEPCTSPANVVDHLLDGKRQLIGLRIQSAISAGNFDAVHEAYADLRGLEVVAKDGHDEDWDASEENIFDPLSDENRILTGIPQVDARLRLVRGDHLILIGRPNMGKTLMWIQLIAHLATEGRKVCVYENEESPSRTSLRTIARLLDRTSEQCRENQHLAFKAARERGFGNIRWRYAHPGSIRNLDRWLEAEKPDLFIVNQIRNIRTDDSLVHSLESMGQEVRNLAGKHNAVGVSVTQAGESASGKAMLSMSDLDSSKTGLPGACDHIMAMGATEEMMATDRRMISFPKVKGESPEGFMVTIDPSRSKFK
jgi:hypothetical protein